MTNLTSRKYQKQLLQELTLHRWRESNQLELESFFLKKKNPGITHDISLVT